MSTLAGKQEFFTWEEFGLCRTAAGFDSLCCYAPPPQGEPSVKGLMETVFNLVRRGRLAEGSTGFLATGETGENFRLMGQAGSVLFVYRREYRIPVCLLYGGTELFVSMQPGHRKGEYVGLSRYSYEELPEWIADLGITLPSVLPDDLLSTVRDNSELQGAAVLEFLAGRSQELPPEEIPWFVERRRVSDGLPLAKLFLVRQPIFDQIVISSKEKVTQRLYHAAALAEALETLLKDKED